MSSSQFSAITQFSTVVAANADLDPKIWQMKVRKTARQKNVLREMIGGEGSANPIIEVTDLRKGPGDTVVVNTLAPTRAQGTLGEARLLNNIGKVYPGTFEVTIDYLRHMIAWTQKFQEMTVAGMAKDELTSNMMGDWLHRKEEDDLQWALLRTARLIQPNLLTFVNGEANDAALLSADSLTTGTIEDTKGVLMAQGAKPISIDKDVSGADDAKYIFFTPNPAARSLRSSTAFQTALQNADVRGKDNRLFTGKYGLWENMVIFPHELVYDDAAGRQGSPLAPFATLGTALTDATTTTLTGGGASVDPANAGTADFFANFHGFLLPFTSEETPPADAGPHYIMIFNVTGALKGFYEIVSYTTGNNGNTITGVTRGTTSNLHGNVIASNAGVFATSHPQGSFIFPCTINGVPYCDSLGLGAECLAYAHGKHTATPIEWEDDGREVQSKQPFQKGFGMMSVRGMAPFQNVAGFYPNFCAIRSACRIPGIGKGPVAYTGQ